MRTRTTDTTDPTDKPAGKRTSAVDQLRHAFRRRPGEHDHRVLYRVVQDAIRRGLLPAASQLPPSRVLATALDIARNTVVHVYAQLALEGYVQAGVGRGTFVARTVPRQLSTRSGTGLDAADPGGDGSGDHLPADGIGKSPGPAPTPRTLLSRRGATLVDRAGAASLQWGAFTPGVPEVRQFPAAVWSRLQSRLWRNLAPPQLSYASGGGDAGLRYAIAEHLRATRGVHCAPEQVLVTSGTQQSLQLVAQLLADPGDAIWIEDPGYWGARSVFQALGLKLVPVRVDAEGLAPTAAQWRDAPRAVFVTPAHQYPSGALMSAARRRQLLDQAALRGVWIIEDDYDSEFRYGSRPLPALQGLDTHQRVLFLGTFSKTLFPALRLAYVVLPPGLVEGFGRALAELFREGQTPQQAVLARFISEGHYASHIRRMRAVYGARHDALIAAIAKHFGTTLPVMGGDAGLHLVLGLPPRVDDAALAQRIAQAGVASRPLSLYQMRRPATQRGLVLGYGAVDEVDIARHFGRLAGVVERWLDLSRH
ncbi:MAG: PLP-dependent aminotransferase family protein [Rubrivivax sp.]